MNIIRIAAIILIVGGILGLVYGSVNYTNKTHELNVGTIELSLEEKERIRVPTWAAITAIVAGGSLLVLGNKRH